MAAVIFAAQAIICESWIAHFGVLGHPGGKTAAAAAAAGKILGQFRKAIFRRARFCTYIYIGSQTPGGP